MSPLTNFEVEIERTTMEHSSDKTVKLPLFDGTVKSYQTWKMQLEFYAAIYGFTSALEKGGDPNMPASHDATIDETKAEGKLQAKAKKTNLIAMGNLAMSFKTDTLVGIVNRSKSKEWPHGLAWKVMESLKKKFEPQDNISMVELRIELSKVSMKKNDNPEVIFDQISKIKNRFYEENITKADLVSAILAGIDPSYVETITNEMRRLGDEYEIEDLAFAANQVYRARNARKPNTGDDNNELTLSAFGGTCFKCKKKGHKANACPEKNDNQESGESKNQGGNGNNNKKKFNGKCHQCGKEGHRSSD